MEAPTVSLHKPYNAFGQRCTWNAIARVTSDVVPVDQADHPFFSRPSATARSLWFPALISFSLSSFCIRTAAIPVTEVVAVPRQTLQLDAEYDFCNDFP